MQRYHNRQYGGSPICIEWEAAAKILLAGHASRWGEAEKPPLLSLCLRVSLSRFLSLWSNLNSQWHNSPFIFLFSPVSDFSVSLSNDGHYLLHSPSFFFPFLVELKAQVDRNLMDLSQCCVCCCLCIQLLHKANSISFHEYWCSYVLSNLCFIEFIELNLRHILYYLAPARETEGRSEMFL